MKKIAAIIIFAILGFSAFAQSQMGKDAPAPQWQSYEEALFQIGKLNRYS